MPLLECELELLSNVIYLDQRLGKQPEDTCAYTRNQASSPGGGVVTEKGAV